MLTTHTKVENENSLCKVAHHQHELVYVLEPMHNKKLCPILYSFQQKD